MGLSVYGLGRFPVTLYKEQWLSLLDIMNEIRVLTAAKGERLKSGRVRLRQIVSWMHCLLGLRCS